MLISSGLFLKLLLRLRCDAFILRGRGGNGRRARIAAFAKRVRKFGERSGSGGDVLRRCVGRCADKAPGIYDRRKFRGFGERCGDALRGGGRDIGGRSDSSSDGSGSFAGECVGIDVGDDGVFGRLEPFTIFGDVREEAHGSENGGGGGGGSIIDVLENAFGDAAKIASAAGDEAEGFGVTVEAGAVGKEIFAADAIGVAPADELIVDCFAIGVVADATFASVAAEADGARSLRVGSGGIAG